MAWQEEITDAKYTSPSGKTFTFYYGALKKDTDLKTATFTFPDVDGALVMPLGRGWRRFPLSCRFYGEDCLTQADNFEKALEETGIGTLQHPIYGQRKVVPTGSISRSDNLTTDLNTSTVEITFAETITDQIFPASEIQQDEEIAEAVNACIEKTAEDYAKQMNFDKKSDAVAAQKQITSMSKVVTEQTDTLAQKSSTVYSLYSQQKAELNNNLSNFVSNAKNVALSIFSVAKSPAQIAIDASAKISAYTAVTRNLTSNFSKNLFSKTRTKAQYINSRLCWQSSVLACASGIAYALSAKGKNETESTGAVVTGLSLSSGNGKFRSREDAVNAATEILELFDQYTAFENKNLAENYNVDVGAGYEDLLKIVVLSTAKILNYAFSLKSKHTIVLDRPRQVIELVAELYNGDFSKVDDFICDNKLNINELEILPLGKKVSYYA